MGASTDSVAIEDVIKMVEGFKEAPPNGRKEIALLRHYRCVVLDKQSYLALMHAVLQSARQFTTEERACSTGNI